MCRYYISTASPYTSSHFYGFKATDCATIAVAATAGTISGFSNERWRLRDGTVRNHYHLPDNFRYRFTAASAARCER